jgi:hypothetical protein
LLYINSTGKYITILGSDDKFHTKKLKKQVNVLINNPNIIATDAYFQRRWKISRNNEVTLMFRKKVIDKIGYFDSVRFGADSEFKARLINQYGSRSIKKIKAILYYAESRQNSLTHSKESGRSIRNKYVASYRKWHRKGGKYMPYPLKITDRPFKVDKVMLP